MPDGSAGAPQAPESLPPESLLPESSSPADQPRRSFFASLTAAAMGLLALFVPLGSGLAVLVDPLRRPRQQGKRIRIASLSQVPADGIARRFAVVDRAPIDKWSRYAPQPIGSVYLVRYSEGEPPVALSSVCPHLGCTVTYDTSAIEFLCPCHNAVFAADGSRVEGNKSVSPRDLDPLPVTIRNDDEIWVEYRRYKCGTTERVEV